ESVDIGQRGLAVGGQHRAIEVLVRVLRPAHYQLNKAPSAAKPGPSPIITPHSPGTGDSSRSISSSTKRMVADDMLPYWRRTEREWPIAASSMPSSVRARSRTRRPAECSTQ